MTGPSRVADFTLADELGRGVTGAVYRATSGDGETVAVKVFDAALSRDDEYRARFRREVGVARDIEDNHLVRILDAGEADGRLYIALELVGGGSLGERLTGGPLPLDDALRVVSDVAAGLDVLHRAGVVHRDVKPANVMLRDDGSAALTDFGLAKGVAHTVLTRPGQVLGTLDYLAPELIQGGEATPASDVYALGCVAFECLTGRPPFADRSLFGVGRAHLEDDPPDPPASPEVSWALLRALEKDPARRPATAMTYARLVRAAIRH